MFEADISNQFLTQKPVEAIFCPSLTSTLFRQNAADINVTSLPSGVVFHISSIKISTESRVTVFARYPYTVLALNSKHISHDAEYRCWNTSPASNPTARLCERLRRFFVSSKRTLTTICIYLTHNYAVHLGNTGVFTERPIMTAPTV